MEEFKVTYIGNGYAVDITNRTGFNAMDPEQSDFEKMNDFWRRVRIALEKKYEEEGKHSVETNRV